MPVMWGAAVVAGLLVAPATGDRSKLALAWDGPAECPSRAEIDAAVAEILAGSVVDRPVAAAMSAVRTEQGFRIQIALEDDGTRSERTLEGADCRELGSTAALIVAMTIDPRLGLGAAGPTSIPPPPEPEPEPQPEPEATGSDPEGSESPDARSSDEATTVAAPPRGTSDADREPNDARERDRLRRAPGLRFAGQATVGLGLGPLPAAPSAVIGVALGIRGPRWQADAIGEYWSPRTGDSQSNPAVGVAAQLWALGVRGCVLFPLGNAAGSSDDRRVQLEVPLCGNARAGLMHAVGTGELQRIAASSPWAAAGIGSGLTVWLRERIALGVAAEGHAALARTLFVTDPSGTAHRAGPVGGSLGIVLGVRAP